MSQFEKLIEFVPGFDKRDPDPHKNYGVGAMRIRFILKGAKGATQFMLGTDWYPEHVQREHWARRFDLTREFFRAKPDGWDIGYHSPTAQYEGQTVIENACEYLDGRPCYYDGSGLQADEFVPEFLTGGADAVWAMLERRYHNLFDNAPAEAQL